MTGDEGGFWADALFAGAMVLIEEELGRAEGALRGMRRWRKDRDSVMLGDFGGGIFLFGAASQPGDLPTVGVPAVGPAEAGIRRLDDRILCVSHEGRNDVKQYKLIKWHRLAIILDYSFGI